MPRPWSRQNKKKTARGQSQSRRKSSRPGNGAHLSSVVTTPSRPGPVVPLSSSMSGPPSSNTVSSPKTHRPVDEQVDSLTQMTRSVSLEEVPMDK
jgi:hypothetical protein